MNQLRLPIAVIVAPFAAPATTILLAIASSGMAWPYNGSDIWWTFGVCTVFGFVGLVVAGWPTIAALRRMKSLNLISLTLSGAVAGVAVFALFLTVLGMLLESEADFGLLAAMYGAIIGAAGIENLTNDRKAA
jgi:hypothetical protein